MTQRFGMPWSDRAARMREYVQALRAIWANWYQGEPLRFEGRLEQIDDALLEEFAVIAPPGEVGNALAARYGDFSARVVANFEMGGEEHATLAGPLQR